MANIDSKLFSTESPVYVIAEIGQAHDGSLGSAHAYIDAVAETGVDAIKFQTHIAKAESTHHEKFRVNVFPQDETRFDYWKRMEFTPEQWKGLADHAKDKGLDFLSTPFSTEAVDLLEDLNVPAWKVGSGDVANSSLIDAMLKTDKPILLSSGMSSYSELESTISKIKHAGVKFALFQCTTSYPCEADDIGYNVITEMMDRFGCPVGLSDHSGTPYPSLAAITLGAKIIEVHTVFSKKSFGPDVMSSLTIEELKGLVDGIRFIEKGLKNPVCKEESALKRLETKNLFSRSAFYSKEMVPGDTLSEAHIAMKKPGGGMAFEKAKLLVGKKVTTARCYDDYVQAGDFE